MQNQEPPEPFKSALIDTCMSLVPTLKEFRFSRASGGVRLKGRMRVLITKAKLSRSIAFSILDLPKEEAPWLCYIKWRF